CRGGPWSALARASAVPTPRARAGCPPARDLRGSARRRARPGPRRAGRCRRRPARGGVPRASSWRFSADHAGSRRSAGSPSAARAPPGASTAARARRAPGRWSRTVRASSWAETVRPSQDLVGAEPRAPGRLDVESEAVTAPPSGQTHRLLLEDAVARASGETERGADPLAADPLDARGPGDLHRASVALYALRLSEHRANLRP